MSNVPTLLFQGAYTAGTTVTLTTTATATVGQQIFVWMNVDMAGGTPPASTSCTDDAGNVYTLWEQWTSAGSTAGLLWVCQGANAPLASGKNIYVTFASAPPAAGIAVSWSDNGIGATAPTGTGMNAGSGSSATAATQGYPVDQFGNTYTECNVYACFATASTANPTTPPAGMTLIGSGLTSGWTGVYYETILVGGGGSNNYTATGLSGVVANTCLGYNSAVAPPAVTAPNPLPSGVTGEGYTQQLTPSGGLSSTYTYGTTGGSLPAGLSFSGNTITGTITAPAGTYSFNITINDGSVTDSYPFTLTVVASGASGLNVPASKSIPGNLLNVYNQSFYGSGSLAWAANTNCNAPFVSTFIGFETSQSLGFTNPALGVSSVNGPLFPCMPGEPYLAGGFVMPASGVNTGVRMGLTFYNGTSFTTVWGPTVTPSYMGQWVPVYVAGVAPAGAIQYTLLIEVLNPQVNDHNHAGLLWTMKSDAQVLIDWVSQSFGDFPSGGNYFVDVSPWVDVENSTINLSRGRKDAVSEVSPGTASFTMLNDSGWFSPDSFATSLPGVTGGLALDVGARTQVNLTDTSTGAWFTRFDGACGGATYDTSDNSGNTSSLQVSAGGVMGYLNRQPTDNTWTESAILADNPEYFWPMDDAGSNGANGASNGGTAREVSGNGYGVLHATNSDPTVAATIGWADTSGGVETQGDASGPNLSNGSQFWFPFRNEPGSLVRGPITGATGPYTTPMGSVLLTPTLSAQSAINQWSGNLGYSLTGLLTGPPINTAVSQETDIELWFTCNSEIAAACTANLKYGPYCQFTLGGTRGPLAICAGVFLNGTGGATYQVGLLTNRPGAAKKIAGTTAPVFAASCSVAFTPDTTPVPHRLYLQIFGGQYGPYLQATLDGTVIGTFNLPSGAVFDRITLGSGPDGTGAHFGNISACAIYGNTGGLAPLSSGRSVVHTQLGLYGNFEMTTDDSVAALGAAALVPTYWNGLAAQGAGKMITDYYDINTNNALVNMQIFEQMEMGLLYENAAGQLTFHTGDWRQGYGAPDLALPVDTFEGDVQLSRTVQYMQNAVTVTSLAYTTGGSAINDASQAQYGPYFSNYTSAQAAGGYVASSIQLPLFGWNRAAASLGIQGLQFQADPYFTDYANWTSTKFGTPWTQPGQISFDLLTLDPAKLTTSQLYGIDIDNMVVPTGTLPASWPDNARALEWFVEGIDETFAQETRTLTLYCSPASTQRAWKLGDATYGVLGTTSRIGVSAADVSIPEAYGKAVSHDAGRPYWSPDFGYMAGDFANDGDFTSGGVTNWNSFQVTASWQNAPPGNCPSPYAVSLGTFTGTSNWFYQLASVLPNTVYTIGMWVRQATGGGTVSLGMQGFDATNTNLQETQRGPTLSLTAGVWQLQQWTFTTGPSTRTLRWGFSNQAAAGQYQCTRFRIAKGTAGLNNPSGNGHGHVGSNEMRGIYDSLSLKMRPPMLVAALQSSAVSLAVGTQSAGLPLDTIFVDTENGMGLMANYPNWYVVQRAGWYDIDFSAAINAPSSGTAGPPLQAMITVAIGAGQVGNPLGGGVTYSCPLGESRKTWVKGVPNNSAGSAQLYLGAGDAVAIWLQQDFSATLTTPTANYAASPATPGGGVLSMLWRGYGRTANHVTPNTSASTGGTTTTGNNANYKMASWGCTATYAYNNYFGSPQQRSTLITPSSSTVYQGFISNSQTGTDKKHGSSISQLVFPTASMRTLLNAAGTTVVSAYLTGTLTGAPLQSMPWSVQTFLGAYDGTPGKKVFNPIGSPHGVHVDLGSVTFNQANTAQQVPIPLSILKDLLGSSTCILLGDGAGSTMSGDSSGQWNGAAGDWILTVYYVVKQ